MGEKDGWNCNSPDFTRVLWSTAQHAPAALDPPRPEHLHFTNHLFLTHSLFPAENNRVPRTEEAPKGLLKSSRGTRGRAGPRQQQPRTAQPRGVPPSEGRARCAPLHLSAGSNPSVTHDMRGQHGTPPVSTLSFFFFFSSGHHCTGKVFFFFFCTGLAGGLGFLF